MDLIHMPALVKSDKVDICLSEIAVQAIISEYTKYSKYTKKCKGAWIYIMNSSDSVESIKRTNTLFPSDVNEYDISLADIKEGEKFLSACKSGDTKQVKKCLDSLNTSVLNRINADFNDFTGLHYACDHGMLDVVKLLVNHQQINVNVKTRSGDSALYWCIDNKEVATVLLESGKLNFQGMKRVENFAESDNGSFQFEFRHHKENYLIKMDSPTTLNSIASRA